MSGLKVFTALLWVRSCAALLRVNDKERREKASPQTHQTQRVTHMPRLYRTSYKRHIQKLLSNRTSLSYPHSLKIDRNRCLPVLCCLDVNLSGIPLSSILS